MEIRLSWSLQYRAADDGDTIVMFSAEDGDKIVMFSAEDGDKIVIFSTVSFPQLD